jgi:putative endonuclease
MRIKKHGLFVIVRLDRANQNHMQKSFCVYILASRRNGTLYICVTSDLLKRVWEHKEKLVRGFTAKYGVDRLVYYEQFQDVENALRREKRLKQYKRKWKLDLIEESNPEWKDLYEEILSGFPDQVGE